MLKPIGTATIVRERRRWEAFPAGGGTSHLDGTVTATLEVFVDVAKLVEAIGSKALHSKSGRSRLQGGAVEVRLVHKVSAPLVAS